MTPERRAYNRRHARQKRERLLQQKLATAQKCPKRHGSGVCNGPLETRIGTVGQSIVVCLWCERQRVNRCRFCDRRCASPGPNALYCAEHREQVKRRQMRACDERHKEEYRKRAQERYQASDKQRKRSAEYKRLWRKANPEKVRAQKKRYVERHRGKASSSYVRYHAKYRKRFALHRRELVHRLTARQRKPIPDCAKCGKSTGWTPVSALHPGRPWSTCMKCAWPHERKKRRKARRLEAKRIAADPDFGMKRHSPVVRRPTYSPPRGPDDERICITPGCDTVLTHRKKKCTKCRQRDAQFAAQELAKTHGRGRRVDLERRRIA